MKTEYKTIKDEIGSIASYYYNASWGRTQMKVPVSSEMATHGHQLFDNFVCNIITESGLKCDTYQAETEDGFKLSMFRVRDPKNFKEGAPAALL